MGRIPEKSGALVKWNPQPVAIDKLLAHQPTKLRGVAAIYQRYDFAAERARALDGWAEHVLNSNAGAREPPLNTAMLVVVAAGRRSIRSRRRNSYEDAIAFGALLCGQYFGLVAAYTEPGRHRVPTVHRRAARLSNDYFDWGHGRCRASGCHRRT
jgi:hypothetical protein